jgi:hypothetical protein
MAMVALQTRSMASVNTDTALHSMHCRPCCEVGVQQQEQQQSFYGASMQSNVSFYFTVSFHVCVQMRTSSLVSYTHTGCIYFTCIVIAVTRVMTMLAMGGCAATLVSTP